MKSWLMTPILVMRTPPSPSWRGSLRWRFGPPGDRGDRVCGITLAGRPASWHALHNEQEPQPPVAAPLSRSSVSAPSAGPYQHPDAGPNTVGRQGFEGGRSRPSPSPMHRTLGRLARGHQRREPAVFGLLFWIPIFRSDPFLAHRRGSSSSSPGNRRFRVLRGSLFRGAEKSSLSDPAVLTQK